MQHDPMHWKLTLVRSRKDRETGVVKYYSVKDTAANRNAGRFQKMDKPRDQKWTSRGCGVTYDQKPLSRAAQERIAINAVARDLVQVVTSEVTIVAGPVRSTLSARARRRSARA